MFFFLFWWKVYVKKNLIYFENSIKNFNKKLYVRNRVNFENIICILLFNYYYILYKYCFLLLFVNIIINNCFIEVKYYMLLVFKYLYVRLFMFFDDVNSFIEFFGWDVYFSSSFRFVVVFGLVSLFCD